jgi:predicted DNA-binding protein YlxM (UPF0122 family)
MSTVVDASIPAGELALADSMKDHPDATFQLCRVVANTTDDVMPFLWASGGDRDELLASFEADPTIGEPTVIIEFDGEYLFEMEWIANVPLLFDVFMSEDGAVVLDAYSNGMEWHFQLVLPDQQYLESVSQKCEQLELGVDVERVYPLSESFRRDQFQLTEKQYETVLTAYEEGYYDVPRTADLKELAHRLDISHQALSERLRRGHAALIANGLEIGPERPIISEGPLDLSNS